MIEDSESVQDHVKTMLEMFNEFSIVGDAIKDEDWVVYLLASLPESFNTLVTVLELNPTIPEIKIIIGRLMHKEAKGSRSVKLARKWYGALSVRHKAWLSEPKCYIRLPKVQACPRELSWMNVLDHQQSISDVIGLATCQDSSVCSGH